MKYRLPMLLPIAMILAGCETGYKNTVLKLKAVKAPEEISAHCDMSKPMTKTAYLALKQPEREEELAKFIIKLAGDLRVCDSRLTAVRNYEEEVAKILKESDKK